MALFKIKLMNKIYILSYFLCAINFSCALIVEANESLDQALIEAYNTNPHLLAERHALKGADEKVAESTSHYRPKLTAGGYVGSYQNSSRSFNRFDSGQNRGANTSKLRSRSAALSLEQPLDINGKITAEVKSSKKDVLAGRAYLKNVEQDLFFDVITVYMAVIRDQAIVELNKKNVEVFEGYLKATSLRHKVGELTPTDVSQAEARLYGAEAEYEQAKVNLKRSELAYEKWVGNKPLKLIHPHFRYALPLKTEDLLEIGLQENPLLHITENLYKAAVYKADAIKRDFFPTLSIVAQTSKGYDIRERKRLDTENSIYAQFSVPLYSGGLIEAKTRAARQRSRQLSLEKNMREREVKERILQAYETLKATDTQIYAREAEVKAADMALKGMNHEVNSGLRITLELLDAETFFKRAQVDLIKIQTSKVVAQYDVLRSLGRLNAQFLKLSVTFYNPKKYYNKASKRWVGIGIED
jgi:outer membrane protein